jgi:hypothetical protein
MSPWTILMILPIPFCVHIFELWLEMRREEREDPIWKGLNDRKRKSIFKSRKKTH